MTALILLLITIPALIGIGALAFTVWVHHRDVQDLQAKARR